MIKSIRRSDRRRRKPHHRRAAIAAGQRSRPTLVAEKLEDRVLLATDFLGWHNALDPTDVNGDGVTGPVDALLVINELNNGGPRSLGSAPIAQAALRAEGEESAQRLVDVNGDGFLSPIDALTVINHLNAEAENPTLVRFRLATTNVGGTAITSLTSGQDFILSAYMQDVRTTVPPAFQGIFGAYIDAAYNDASLFSLPAGNFKDLFVFGPEYQQAKSAENGDFAVAPTVQTTTQGGPAQNEKQEVAIVNDAVPTPTAATFSLTFQAATTAPISFNATAADVETALKDLANIGPNDVSVIGAAGGPWTVEFIGAFFHTNVAQMTANVVNNVVNSNSFSEVGALDGLGVANPLQEKLLWQITLHTQNDGLLSFQLNAADSFGKDVFVFDDPSNPTTPGGTGEVPADQIDWGLPANLVIDFHAYDDVFSNGLAVAEDPLQPYALDVLQNDVLAQGSAGAKNIVASGFSVPDQGGTVAYGVVGTNPVVLYTPALNFFGVETFTYTATDGLLNFSTATVTVTVTPVNDAPVLTAANPSAQTDEDTPIELNLADFINNGPGTTTITDVDPFDPVGGIAIVGAVGNGTFQFDLTGPGDGHQYVLVQQQPAPNNALLLPAAASILYTPDGKNGETATITYRAWDRSNGLAPGTFTNITGTGGATAYSLATDVATLTVTPINDPPQLDLDANNSSGQPGANFATIFTEGGGPVRIADTDATITDVDSPNLRSLTVRITNLLDGASESLAATTTGTTITANYNPATGVLVLNNADDTVAHFQQVLRTVMYNNTSQNPNTTARQITFQANDGSAANNLSNVATTTVTVVAVNNPPAVDLNGADQAGANFAAQFTEVTSLSPGSGPVLIADNDATIVDPDNANLVSMTVTITNPLDGASESLTADTTGTNITLVPYNPATGVLMLNGVGDTVANFQKVLRTVRYDNTSDTPNTTARQITFQANDGSAANNLSNVATTTVTVVAQNDPPVNTVPPQPQKADINGRVVFSTANWNEVSISDPDAGANPVQVTLSVNRGTLTLSQITGLTFSAGDGTADALMTFQGTITNINNALRNNSITYQAQLPAAQPDQLTITTNDLGNTGALGPQQDTDTVTIVFVRPYAGDDHFTALEDSHFADNPLNVLANDLASDGATLVILPGGFTQPVDGGAVQRGQVRLMDNGTPGNTGDDFFQFEPDPDFFGVLTFTYTVNDTAAPNNDGPDTATVTIDVQPVNDPPVLDLNGDDGAGADFAAAFTEGAGAVVVADGDATIKDIDSPNLGSVTVTILNRLDGASEVLSANTTGTSITANYNAATGVLTLNNSSDTLLHFQQVLRTVRYENLSRNPDTADRIITFRVNDGAAANNLSNIATTTVTIAPVNDPPELDLNGADGAGVNYSAAFTEGSGPVAIADADATVFDVDSANLAWMTVTIANLLDGANEVLTANTTGTSITANYNPATGVLRLNNADDTVAHFQQVLRTVRYENSSENPNTTARQITVLADDGQAVNHLSAPVTTTLTIVATNDAPQIFAPTGQSTTEDQPLVFSNAGGNAISVADVDANSLQVALSAVHGTLTLSHPEWFAFSAGDGTADASMTFTGTIANINAALGGNSLTFTPSENFNDSMGAASLSIAVNDLGATGAPGPQPAAATVAISVTAVNDKPIATPDGGPGQQILILLNGGPQLVDGILDNDAPGPATATDEVSQDIRIASVNGIAVNGGPINTPAGGVVVVAPDGKSFTYTPPAVEVVDQFEYTIVDNGTPARESDPSTITLDVVSYIPSTVEGFVYSDADRDGVKDPAERGMAGVEVRLEGRDVFNQPVQRLAYTDAYGHYAFRNLVPTNHYTVTAAQPMGTSDGQEHVVTPGVPNPAVNQFHAVIEGNDAFGVEIGRLGDARVELHFGELGVNPASYPTFNAQAFFFASTTPDGILFELDQAGQNLWYSFRTVWAGVTSASLELNGAGPKLTVHMDGGASRTVTLNASRHVLNIGRDAAGRQLVYINIDETEFNNLWNRQTANSHGEGERSERMMEGQWVEQLAASRRAGGQADYSRAVDALFAQYA